VSCLSFSADISKFEIISSMINGKYHSILKYVTTTTYIQTLDNAHNSQVKGLHLKLPQAIFGLTAAQNPAFAVPPCSVRVYLSMCVWQCVRDEEGIRLVHTRFVFHAEFIDVELQFDAV